MKVIKKQLVDFIAYIACFVFFVTGTLVSLHRYWQYEVTYIDFGQYDRAIWLVSRFQEPIVYHFIHGRINVLGDHLTPSIFLLSPLYWLTDRSEVILIVQALAVAASGLVLYNLANHILKDRFMSLSVLLCYFLFVGLQNAVITEFHELTVMTFPLMLCFWAIVKNKKILYIVTLLITLGFKEITFALGIGIGIALIVLHKDWRKIGIVTILLSLLWGFLAFTLILPHFSNGKYLYAATFPDGVIGKVLALVDHPTKRHTVLFSLLSFSFLPIFAPEFWLAILQDYASRFLPLHFVTRWDLRMHYNAQSAVLLAIASVFGLKHILRFPIIRTYRIHLSVLFIINAFILFRFVLHGPFLLAFNPAFYQQTKHFEFLNTMVAKIPKDASVMSHNNLAARFTHQDVRLLTPNYSDTKPDYILIDIRDGQSPNNFCCTYDVQRVKQIYQRLRKDKTYMVVFQTEDQFIFKRKQTN